MRRVSAKSMASRRAQFAPLPSIVEILSTVSNPPVRCRVNEMGLSHLKTASPISVIELESHFLIA